MMADKYDAFLDAPDTPVAKTTDKYDAFLDAPVAQLVKQGTPGSSQEVPIKFRHSTNPRDYQQQENLAVLRDFLGGASSLMRGGANIVGSVFGNSKIGEKIWPTALANKDSMAYLAGQISDPAALALGGVATKAAGMVPVASKLAPVVHGAIGGGLAGAATGAITNEEDRLGGAGTGAVVGGAVGGVVPIAGKAIQKGVGWAYDVAKGRTGQVKAGQIARASAGGQLPAIRTALENADPRLTAAQAASDVPQDMWQSLGKVAQGADRNSYYSGIAAKQEAARKGLLTSVTPDLATAQSNLSVGNTVNYGNAARADAQRLAQLQTSVNPPAPVVQPSPLGLGITERVAGTPQVVSTIKSLGNLESLPAFDAAKKEAVKLIASLPDMPADVKARLMADPTSSVQGLHFIKMAIDNRFKNPNIPSSFENVSKETLTGIKSKLTDAMKASSPEYDVARKNAIDLYKPVNQSNVLGELSSILEKPMVGERATPFVNALGRGEDAALRRAGLDARFGGLDDVLTPTQMSAVNTVKGELTRDATMKKSAEEGADALRSVIDELSITFRLPPMFRTEVSAMNKVLEVAEKNLSAKTKLALSEGMKSGKSAIELLNTLPTSEKNKLLMIMGQASKMSGAAGAVSGVQAGGGK